MNLPANAPNSRPGRASLWMAFFLVAIVGKLSEWVPGMSVVPLAKIAFLITAIYAYRERARLLPVRVRSLVTARPAIAFLVLSVVSVIFSVYKSNSLSSIQAPIIYLAAFVLLVKITQTQIDIERQLMAFSVAAVALSGAVLLDYQGGRATINRNFDPNDLAYGLVTLLPIVLALAGVAVGTKKKLLLLMTLPIVIAVLLTGSRGGAVGLGVVLLLLAAFPLSFTKDGRLRQFSLRRLTIRLGVLGILAAVLFTTLPSETRERLVTLNHLGEDYNASLTLNSSRLAVWTRDAAMVLKRPIGYGIASAEAVDGMSGGAFRTVHNSIVQALVELGVLGCGLFLYSYYIAWKELGRVHVSVPEDESIDRRKLEMYARALQIALAGNIVAGFFLSQAYASLLWMMIGLSAALVRISDLHKPASVSASKEQYGERALTRPAKMRRVGQ
jgi:O-antigen ligase